MSVIGEDVRRFLDGRSVGVLATQAGDGRPRQSVVYFAHREDRLLISTDSGRRKAEDVRRSGWASLCVAAHEPPYASATLAGRAEILTEGIGELTAAVMQRVIGLEEPPEPQTDEALAGVGRVILAITVERVGPVSYIPAAA